MEPANPTAHISTIAHCEISYQSWELCKVSGRLGAFETNASQPRISHSLELRASQSSRRPRSVWVESFATFSLASQSQRRTRSVWDDLWTNSLWNISKLLKKNSNESKFWRSELLTDGRTYGQLSELEMRAAEEQKNSEFSKNGQTRLTPPKLWRWRGNIRRAWCITKIVVKSCMNCFPWKSWKLRRVRVAYEEFETKNSSWEHRTVDVVNH